MKKQILKWVIILVAISLVGIVVTQTFWLKNSITIAEQQFGDRADRMLGDVKNEIREFVDTSHTIHIIPDDSLTLFDVVDTSLLAALLSKYITYHRLDTSYSYGLVESGNNKLLYGAHNFNSGFENEVYKTCLSCIWKKKYVHISVYFPEKNKTLYSQLYGWIFMSIIFVLVITGAFVYIIYSNIRQKKLSEIKNDFINNMTHEFKTPISTISLASEMLIKGAKSSTPERICKYSKIIFDENQRMQSQVELVLQAALIDRGQLKLKIEPVNFHDLLQSTVDSFCISSCEKDAQFEYVLNAREPNILVDVLHIRNIIGNLIDNAIKYCNCQPRIRISTENVEGGLQLALADNGIGMPREATKKVFEKFFRVSTGNVHNVKGFGLGLYYVKTIVEAHHGWVRVHSILNNGSTFYVFLPGKAII
jgi:two-component system phosphate regulon sensor histidine kinase PhoR